MYMDGCGCPEQANSFLPAVLRRKRGIPITCCLAWCAVARRLGLHCYMLAAMPYVHLPRATLLVFSANECRASERQKRT